MYISKKVDEQRSIEAAVNVGLRINQDKMKNELIAQIILFKILNLLSLALKLARDTLKREIFTRRSNM
jgi:hypothetical protein